MELTAREVLDPDEISFLALVGGTVLLTAQITDPGPALALLAVAPAVLAFVFQGRLAGLAIEVRAALVAGPIVAVVTVGQVLEPLLFLSVMMVLYTSATSASGGRAGAVAAVAALAPLAVGLAVHANITWAPWVMAHAFTFSMGRLLLRQQVLILQLDEAREALAHQAVADERRRIARELHDLAGHTLAAMLLHVTGARHVLRRDLDDAEAALRDAEAVGRGSLDQIRATVAALRTDERGTDRALADPSDLADLVDEYRRAGLEVTTDIAPAVAGLDGPVGTAVHRIGREALANVARHAPTNAVALHATVTERTVVLTVADHGSPAPGPNDDRAHFGLLGMTERARALGGTLEAGATADGWRVEARLPLTPGVGP